MTKAPIIDPVTRPRPPASAVPPSTVAPMASISNMLPVIGCAVCSRDATIRPDKRRAQAGEGIDEYFRFHDRHAGEAGGRSIAADGVDVAAKRRFGGQPVAQHEEADHQPDRQIDAEQGAGAEGGETGVAQRFHAIEIRVGAPVVKQQRGAAGDVHHA